MGVLKIMGVKPQPKERVVRSGKIAAATGVSAGIDLALWLAGEIAGSEQAGQANIQGVHTQAAGAGIRRYDNGL